MATDVETQSAEPQPEPAIAPARGARVFAVLAIFFFVLPVPAYLVGMRAKAIENRPLASFPHLEFSWSALDGLGAWFIDRVPFKPDAVKWRGDISDSVFGEPPPTGSNSGDLAAGIAAPAPKTANGSGSPAPQGGEAPARAPTAKQERDFLKLPPLPAEQPLTGTSDVVAGKDGWLYLAGELYKECNPGQPRENVIAGLRRLEQILTASGRKFAFALAPDKSTAEPEHLPGSYPFADCSRASKDQTYGMLHDAAIPGYVDARALIQAREAAEKREYYQRQDTHWNGVAGAAISTELAKKLDPTLATGTTTRESVQQYTGDLTTLLGRPQQDRGLDAQVVRPGVTSTRSPAPPIGGGVQSIGMTSTSTGARLLPGRTLMIGDSFAESLVDKLAPFASDFAWLHNGAVRQVPQTTAEEIAKAKSILVVWNERYFADPAYGVLWSPQFLDKLEQRLQQAG